MARPTKYNAVRRERLLNALRLGCTRKTATLTAGISEDTFARWMRNNADFAEAIARAEHDAVARNIALIARAANRNWRAAAWWLERTRPETYKLRNGLSISTEELEAAIQEEIDSLKNGDQTDKETKKISGD